MHRPAYRSIFTDYLKPPTWLLTIIGHNVWYRHCIQSDRNDGSAQVPYHGIRDSHALRELSKAMATQSASTTYRQGQGTHTPLHCAKGSLTYLKSLLCWILVSVLVPFCTLSIFELSQHFHYRGHDWSISGT